MPATCCPEQIWSLLQKFNEVVYMQNFSQKQIWIRVWNIYFLFSLLYYSLDLVLYMALSGFYYHVALRLPEIKSNLVNYDVIYGGKKW